MADQHEIAAMAQIAVTFKTANPQLTPQQAAMSAIELYEAVKKELVQRERAAGQQHIDAMKAAARRDPSSP